MVVVPEEPFLRSSGSSRRSDAMVSNLLLGVVSDADDRRLPDVARACVAALGAQLRTLEAQILQFDRMIRAWHRSSEASRRLDDIPGSIIRCWR